MLTAQISMMELADSQPDCDHNRTQPITFICVEIEQ